MRQGDPMRQDRTSDPVRPTLRLWPALVLVAVLWLLGRVPVLVGEASPTVFMIGFFGPAACALLILVWWLAGSRATRREKLIGALGLAAILVITTLLAHPSVRGFSIIGNAVPWGFTAFVAGLVAARWVAPHRRLAIGLGAAALAFGFWTLVRMEGVWGDFRAQRAWRWQPTAEERYLAEREQSTGTRAVARPIGEVEWPGFRGPRRDGVVPGAALAEDWTALPPRELWRIRVGPGWSSFAVAGRRLFTQEQRGELEVVVAYDAETGAELWAHESPSRFFETLGGAGPRATPTLSDGRLFALGAEGLLHRLDPTTGEVVWQADLRTDAEREPPMWGFASSPLVLDEVVLVHAGGEGDRGLLAYGVDDGRLRWGAPAGDHSYSSPQLAEIAGERYVPVVSGEGMTLHDPEDGTVVWDYEWSTETYRALQPLVVGDSSLLISTGQGVGTRRLDLRREAGGFSTTERWTSRGLKPDFNDYAAHEGHLYGFDPNILACIDLETGEQRWKGGRYGHGQLLLLPDADQLLVLSEKGEIVLVRATPEKLEELARLPVLHAKTWNHPVLVNDRLYVRNGEEAVALAMPLAERRARRAGEGEEPAGSGGS
jgi:outer membrane protein assembly factor BamB